MDKVRIQAQPAVSALPNYADLCNGDAAILPKKMIVLADCQIAELAVECGLPYGPETWNALRDFAHNVQLLTKDAAALSDKGAQAPAWQKIATAPRDGQNILLRFGKDGVSQGKYVPGLPHPWKFLDTNDGITWLINHAVDGPGGPSHWMPIPDDAAVPQQEARAQECHDCCISPQGQHEVHCPEAAAVLDLPDHVQRFQNDFAQHWAVCGFMPDGANPDHIHSAMHSGFTGGWNAAVEALTAVPADQGARKPTERELFKQVGEQQGWVLDEFEDKNGIQFAIHSTRAYWTGWRARASMASPAAATQPMVPNWAGEFKTYDQWVNKGQSWLKSPSHRPAICIDAKGRRCALGADMMRARDEGAFPVRYFWDCESATTQQAGQKEQGK